MKLTRQGNIDKKDKKYEIVFKVIKPSAIYSNQNIGLIFSPQKANKTCDNPENFLQLK